MSDCKHGLASGTCSICGDGDEPIVYISGGGQSFHRRPNCEALRGGQEKVGDRGGQISTVKPVSLREAERQGRRPCRTCAR